MFQQNEILPMSADDVTHLFRSTEKCAPGTRGNTLNKQAYDVLQAALATFQDTKTSEAQLSLSSCASSSQQAEPSTYKHYTREQLQVRHEMFRRQARSQIVTTELLKLYVRAGVAILNTDIISLVSEIVAAECIYTESMYPEKEAKILINNSLINFVKGFVAARGFSSYVL